MKKLFAIAILFVFSAGLAYAEGNTSVEWEFYGSARVSTFYSNWNVDFLDGLNKNPIKGTGGDTDSYEEDLNGNARIGANIKVNDSLTARFEYGAKRDNANIRILWGEWNFGSGSLGVGQHYTPLLFPYSNQVYNIYAMKDGDTNMSLFGMLYGKREPMVRLKFGTFQIAVVKPRLLVNTYYSYSGNQTAYGSAKMSAYLTASAQAITDGKTPAQAKAAGNAAAAVAAGTYITANTSIYDSCPNTEIKVPNIQAKYKLDFDWGHINMAAGFQQFDIENGGESWDVTSYILALGGRVNLGKAYFKGNIWGGQNVANLVDILVSGQVFSTQDGIDDHERDGAGVGYAQWSDGTMYDNTGGDAGAPRGLVDNDAIAAMIVAGYEIRKGLYVEAGYGYTRTKLDYHGAEKDDCHTLYLQSTIFFAEGVFITPEIGYVDMVQEGQPEVLYAGIKWQINF